MTATIHRLADYRNNLRAEGRTLIWRGLCHELSHSEARPFAEDLYAASWQTGRWGVAGFLIIGHERGITVSGWDMGPSELTSEEAMEICWQLGTSSEAEVFR